MCASRARLRASTFDRRAQRHTCFEIRLSGAGQSLDPRHAPLEVLDASYHFIQW
jgi:hypothetical protein